MRKCEIYGIFNLVNGKILVGSSRNISSRWSCYRKELSRNVYKNKHFQRSWNKYLECSFEFRILEECDIDMLLVRENSWMNYYDSLNPSKGYNKQNATQTIVSNGGIPLSEDHKRKIALGRIGKRHSQETKDAISALKKGKPTCWIGRKHTLESRAKMSLVHSGVKRPEGATEKWKASMKEYWSNAPKCSEEKKRKISLALKGRKQPRVTEALTGRTISDSIKKKISETLKKRYAEKRLYFEGRK